MKTCLIISYGPVPTAKHQIVEGGGLRAWGLATGLVKHGIDTTIAVNQDYPQTEMSYQGIKLCNWTPENLPILANSYDSVILSYSMGKPAENVALDLRDNVQLIVDAYVPIYVEISARDSANLEGEYAAYMSVIKSFGNTLSRGDYFLCANETQKIYYTGVLSSLGRINPITYRDNLIDIVPFGIDSQPPAAKESPFRGKLADKDDFVILWFGGLYPWFDIRSLIKAVSRLHTTNPKVKLLVVGGKNPFNPTHEINKQYDEVVAYAEAKGLLGKAIFFVDWVNYADRADWYNSADVVISLNTPGEENRFSWRTRVMDYVWGEMAIATNGGDPLSERLIQDGAAERIYDLSVDGLVNTMDRLLKNRDHLAQLREKVRLIKKDYFWENVTKDLAKVVLDGKRAKDLEFNSLFSDRRIDRTFRERLNTKYKDKLWYKAVRTAYQIPMFAKNYGLRTALRHTYQLAQNRLSIRRDRQYVFISHPLDFTGGPVVLMEILQEFSKKVNPRRIKLVSPFIASNYLHSLRRLGIRLDGVDPRLGAGAIYQRLGLRRSDFVLLNTSAISKNYQSAILKFLADGRLKKALWYVHEDEPALQFRNKKIVQQIQHLLAKDKLRLGVPSVKMQKKYELFFGQKIELIPLHTDVDEKYKITRDASDFDTLRFFLSGPAAEGRKGHTTALFAFYKFFNDHYQKDPSVYRNFKIVFLGMGDDYVSLQVRAIGRRLFKERFEDHGPVPRPEALEKASECNVVVCCSLMEAFALYVAEGMYMGNVVLRNRSSGIDEQLEAGVNGFLIESKDVQHFADTIERLLNKSKITNAQLAKMGQASQRIIAPFADNRYYPILSELDKN
jgi:glycosyltransferase involved in cell wall biosynthesis